MLGQGVEQHGLDAREFAVYFGHVHLVLEILNQSHAAQEEVGVMLACHIGSQSRVGDNFHFGLILENRFNELFSQFHRGERLLVDVDTDGNDDFVEKRQSAHHDGFMAACEGVERTRKEGNSLVVSAM